MMKGKKRDQSKFTFPDLTPITKTKTFPRYTSILNRPDGDGVGIEELDNLQMEIESLLVDAMQRTRTFKLQIMSLENGEESIPAKFKPPGTPSQASSPYTKPTYQKGYQKKGRVANSKLLSTSTASKPVPTESPIVRNDIPDIFWNSIEPYCAEISENDIKLLEDQIQTFEMDCHLKIPPLGKHYTLRWAKEDMEAEIKENSRLRFDSHGTPVSYNKRKLNDLEESQFYGLLDDAKKYQSDTDSENGCVQGAGQQQQFGPLTQRLISALIEQNLMTPFDTDVSSINDLRTSSKPPQHMSPRTLAKQFKSQQSSLEWNIKKELVEQGILDKIDLDDSISADDEIANEIKQLQDELCVISKKCQKTHADLLVSARKEMDKQKVAKKIDSIDTEIKDIFNKLAFFKQANKPVGKKEKERAKKLIKDRETLKANLTD